MKINRLITETEQRLWESSNLDDSFYYQQILERLLRLKEEDSEEIIDLRYYFSEADYSELSEAKNKLHDEVTKLERKLDKIRRILND